MLCLFVVLDFFICSIMAPVIAANAAISWSSLSFCLFGLAPEIAPRRETCFAFFFFNGKEQINKKEDKKDINRAWIKQKEFYLPFKTRLFITRYIHTVRARRISFWSEDTSNTPPCMRRSASANDKSWILCQLSVYCRRTWKIHRNKIFFCSHQNSRQYSNQFYYCWCECQSN